ncbi:hypothetical protein F5I97DRAFT_1831059 [Phlebopus sp. FC_14]|nr:hypothetical protein F5I97DRAFT_1831059 [Phlebopus sp. FC_14]
MYTMQANTTTTRPAPSSRTVLATIRTTHTSVHTDMQMMHACTSCWILSTAPASSFTSLSSSMNKPIARGLNQLCSFKGQKYSIPIIDDGVDVKRLDGESCHLLLEIAVLDILLDRGSGAVVGEVCATLHEKFAQAPLPSWTNLNEQRIANEGVWYAFGAGVGTMARLRSLRQNDAYLILPTKRKLRLAQTVHYALDLHRNTASPFLGLALSSANP